MTARLIKKYANRRLYDTEESRYVTLEDLLQLVLDNKQFEVVDAKDGTDITRSILLQIIVEQEEKGQPILSTRLLEQLIRYYGDNMQAFFSTYLERSMEFFDSQHGLLQKQFEQMLNAAPSSAWKDIAERNLNVWGDWQRDMFRNFVNSGKSQKDEEKDS